MRWSPEYTEWHFKRQKHQIRHKPVLLSSLYREKQYKMIHNIAKAEMEINNYRRFCTAKKGSNMTAPK